MELFHSIGYARDYSQVGFGKSLQKINHLLVDVQRRAAMEGAMSIRRATHTEGNKSANENIARCETSSLPLFL